jgi:DNA (cytosine-5)-methyltransferase 1
MPRKAPISSKLRVLDLFCGGGGAGAGYARVGFEVLGCDIVPQPKNPHSFILGDWEEVLQEYGENVDLIHASPPCQLYSKANKQWRKKGRIYEDLVERVRTRLIENGKPYVIENVPGSPLKNPVMLNGSLFNLKVHRPRLFETSFKIKQPKIPRVKAAIPMGRPIKDGDIIQPVGHFSGVDYARREMEINWLGQSGLSQAIPPAYTEWIGIQFINAGGFTW